MRQTRIENVRQDENGNIVGEPCAHIRHNEDGFIKYDCYDAVSKDDAVYSGSGVKGKVDGEDCILVYVVMQNGILMPFDWFWCNQKLRVTNLTFYHYGIFQ